MRQFQIEKPDERIKSTLQHKIDNLVKPKGSLGMLEKLALQIGLIQQTLSPQLINPHHVIFAADHGIVEEGVSLSPKEVTWQQLFNFLSGGAGVNFFCRQHGFTLNIVDAGVDYDFPDNEGIINKKIRKGTRNYLYEPAMTVDEMNGCIRSGAEIVRDIHAKGCNIISFGEMGIGNTSSSSLWMTCFTGIPLRQCVGAGSGLDDDGMAHKYKILQQVLDKHPGNFTREEILCYFGGYEMVMALGAMCQAAALNMVILVDGFIMTNCMFAASCFYPEILSYAIFGHCGDEAGHKLLIERLGVLPLLNLKLRLGEGTGAICAYPVVDSAVRMINEMKSFDQVNITKYFT
ncbi:MAG: nicotinate-nucleotide--dimethylbenzimidazole phosphoribosyltransferase [Tannerella sp.]|nr:nicotinate-nucleotide--dimethylbenzimidazole phosphoribosyltransferase [Tannerella sp.]